MSEQPAPPKCFLIDGPLMTTIERRNAVRERMTRDLLQADVMFDEREAKRFLRLSGYAPLDVEVIGPEAHQVAVSGQDRGEGDVGVMIEKITIEQLHARFKAQGVSKREHIAFKCVTCGTVQSMASLIKAGCPADRAENQIGFSCEGRWSNAGPWPSHAGKASERSKRTEKRGCDWTLGGFFRVHKLEVVDENGKPRPSFEVASPDEALALERLMAGDAMAREMGES